MCVCVWRCINVLPILFFKKKELKTHNITSSGVTVGIVVLVIVVALFVDARNKHRQLMAEKMAQTHTTTFNRKNSFLTQTPKGKNPVYSTASKFAFALTIKSTTITA